MSRDVSHPHPPRVVLAIDPGRAKCGLAVVRRHEVADDASSSLSSPPPPLLTRVLHREVTTTEHIASRVAELVVRHSPDAVIIGDATGSAAVRSDVQSALAASPMLPLHVVPEAHTSRRARQRYCQENPPRGLLERLLPPGMRTPPCPYDDYVAVLLAEDFFAGSTASALPPSPASPSPPPRR